MLAFLATVSGCIFLSPAYAHETHDHDHDDHDHRAHEAHVHGVWEFFAALDGAQLTVTMKGPLIDVLGFERLPETDDERALVVELKERVTSYQSMLTLDERARCATSAPAAIILPEGFLMKSTTEHDEKAHSHDDHHAHDDEHHNHDSHNDFEVTYLFNCETPTRLGALTVNGFDTFSAIQTVDAVFLSEATTVARQLTRDSRTLTID
ncbi:MAG: DUF2796 domain-containing protein [Pseudomonadota bacterium]